MCQIPHTILYWEKIFHNKAWANWQRQKNLYAIDSRKPTEYSAEQYLNFVVIALRKHE